MKPDPLLGPGFVCFTTRDYALAGGQSLPAASRSLNRLAARGGLTRVTKGIWANTEHPHFTPLGLVPLLLGREQGYVSFLTALHRHGALSQIPTRIQVATTGHGRRLATPVGTFELFQLKPWMMMEGVEWSETKVPYRMASPEKALLDTLYLSTRKGNRFSALPELDFRFDRKRLQSLVKRQIRSETLRKAVTARLSALGK